VTGKIDVRDEAGGKAERETPAAWPPSRVPRPLFSNRWVFA